jgi:hypothetical protein
LPIEKLIIYEIVFCGLATTNVNIVIEVPTAGNISSVTEWLSREINVTEQHLKSGIFKINPG